MLTYITQVLSVFFFNFEKYVDLHHPVIVCSWFQKVCWLNTLDSLFLILKSMLTYIAQWLSVLDFKKVCWLTSPSRCLFLILKSMLTYITRHCLFLISKSMLTYITQLLSVLDFKKYADLHHQIIVCFWFWKVCWLTTPSLYLYLILKRYADLRHPHSCLCWIQKNKCYNVCQCLSMTGYLERNHHMGLCWHTLCCICK